MIVPPLVRQPLFWETASNEPVPDLAWIPWLYGERVSDVIKRSIERGGNGRRPADRNGNVAPANGGAADGDPAF
jgi:hypothetical protein